MKRDELKDIIKECIVEEEFDSIEDVYNESVIGKVLKTIFYLLFGPYIIIFMFMVIIYPFIIIGNKIHSVKVKDLLKKNPKVVKAINDICDNCKKIINKYTTKNAKYLIFNNNDILKDSYFKIFKDKSILYRIPLYYINSELILKDLYDMDYKQYCDYVNFDNVDDYPPRKREINKLLNEIKTAVDKAIKDINSQFKVIGNSNSIHLEYDDEQEDYDNFFNGYFDYKNGISINLIIKFSDPSNINLPENTQKAIEELKTKLKIKVD